METIFAVFFMKAAKSSAMYQTYNAACSVAKGSWPKSLMVVQMSVFSEGPGTTFERLMNNSCESSEGSGGASNPSGEILSVFGFRGVINECLPGWHSGRRWATPVIPSKSSNTRSHSSCSLSRSETNPATYTGSCSWIGRFVSLSIR